MEATAAVGQEKVTQYIVTEQSNPFLIKLPANISEGEGTIDTHSMNLLHYKLLQSEKLCHNFYND